MHVSVDPRIREQEFGNLQGSGFWSWEPGDFFGPSGDFLGVTGAILVSFLMFSLWDLWFFHVFFPLAYVDLVSECRPSVVDASMFIAVLFFVLHGFAIDLL